MSAACAAAAFPSVGSRAARAIPWGGPLGGLGDIAFAFFKPVAPDAALFEVRFHRHD